MSEMTVLLKFALLCLYFPPSFADFWQERDAFLSEEAGMTIGAGLKLNEKEEKVNKLLMELKFREFDRAVLDPGTFPPARHFFHAKKDIEKSSVFKFIQKMPKGGMLHGHDTALASLDFVFNLTFRDNLYGRFDKKGSFSLRFFNSKPTAGDWELLKNMREKAKNLTEFNHHLRQQLSLVVDNPEDVYPDINAIWKKFVQKNSTIKPLITYRPVFEDYFYQVLKEHYEDNVMYLEMRGTLPPVYELNGTNYDEIQVASIYKSVLDKFMLDYPDFYGAKLIYAPIRKVSQNVFGHYLKVMYKLIEKYPDFVAGFDICGQESLGFPLIEFIPKLQNLFKSGIKFFFHAGETNWYGTSTDLNLVDAVLLGTTRIGHGFALLKHPKVLELVKERGIAIEVSPISNQVLKLVDDLRNHPANMYIANNFSVVICNDDPTYWDAKGLSHDFYETFMGLVPRNADLKTLKQLILNSLIYSAMNETEKTNAIKKWENSWNIFVNSFTSEREEL